jgi:hypothetical protein
MHAPPSQTQRVQPPATASHITHQAHGVLKRDVGVKQPFERCDGSAALVHADTLICEVELT